MSIMQTARLSGVDPLQYVTRLLENVSEVAYEPAAWAPWSYQDTLESQTNSISERRAA